MKLLPDAIFGIIDDGLNISPSPRTLPFISSNPQNEHSMLSLMWPPYNVLLSPTWLAVPGVIANHAWTISCFGSVSPADSMTCLLLLAFLFSRELFTPGGFHLGLQRLASMVHYFPGMNFSLQNSFNMTTPPHSSTVPT